MPETRSKHVMVRFTAADKVALKEYADRERMTISGACEQIVMTHLLGYERKRKDVDGKLEKLLDFQRRQARLFHYATAAIFSRKVDEKEFRRLSAILVPEGVEE